MKRRWVIRLIFILPILLCLGGWGWSFTHNGRIEMGRGGIWGSCGTIWGSVTIQYDHYAPPIGLQCDVYRESEAHLLLHPDIGFLGFGYSGPPYGPHALFMPYWFLILVFSSVLFIVWRRTRPKVNPATAFPVEMGKVAS